MFLSLRLINCIAEPRGGGETVLIKNNHTQVVMAADLLFVLCVCGRYLLFVNRGCFPDGIVNYFFWFCLFLAI